MAPGGSRCWYFIDMEEPVHILINNTADTQSNNNVVASVWWNNVIIASCAHLGKSQCKANHCQAQVLRNRVWNKWQTHHLLCEFVSFCRSPHYQNCFIVTYDGNHLLENCQNVYAGSIRTGTSITTATKTFSYFFFHKLLAHDSTAFKWMMCPH